MAHPVFLHTHPYPPYLFDEATKLIVGTLPPPRFTTGALEEGDIDFCYGSRNGQLWRILDAIFDLGLHYETTEMAIRQRKDFLHWRKIGICDIVHSAERVNIDASDLGMQNVELRDMLGYLRRYPNIDTLLFTGGNSKNGPEYFFRRILKAAGKRLHLISDQVPRIHEFTLDNGRSIRTVSLTAPAGTANRAVGSLEEYKRLKTADPGFTTFDFRVRQYRPFF